MSQGACPLGRTGSYLIITVRLTLTVADKEFKMTCYRPIVAFAVGVNGDGKKILKFPKGYNRYSDVYYDEKGIEHPEYEKYLLPCGKCLGCTMKRSRDWTVRMMHELEYSSCACFITLTYNEQFVPRSEYCDYRTGEINESLTLRKSDFQKFMKRLRKYIEPLRIRFFACGEYGSHTYRPHYHAVIFNYSFPDKKVHAVDNGYVQYTSKALEKLWPFGYSLICEVNFATCAYVARYCTKKANPKHNMDYQTFNIEPEFSLMSRRPGIGYQWYLDHKDELIDCQKLYFSTLRGGVEAFAPKFYEKNLAEDFPERFEEIKEKRRGDAIDRMMKMLSETDLDMFEELKVKESKLKEKLARYERKAL